MKLSLFRLPTEHGTPTAFTFDLHDLTDTHTFHFSDAAVPIVTQYSCSKYRGYLLDFMSILDPSTDIHILAEPPLSALFFVGGVDRGS